MRALALLTILILGCAVFPLPAVTNGQPASTVSTNAGLTPLTGKEVFPAKESLLMQEMGKTPRHETQARRFEIVFFVSLPITLMLAYSLMEALARNTYDRNNPERKIQQPHYIYMFSTSILTSLYIAIEDAHRHPAPERPSTTAISETRFELPLVGVRF